MQYLVSVRIYLRSSCEVEVEVVRNVLQILMFLGRHFFGEGGGEGELQISYPIL